MYQPHARLTVPRSALGRQPLAAVSSLLGKALLASDALQVQRQKRLQTQSRRQDQGGHLQAGAEHAQQSECDRPKAQGDLGESVALQLAAELGGHPVGVAEESVSGRAHQPAGDQHAGLVVGEKDERLRAEPQPHALSPADVLLHRPQAQVGLQVVQHHLAECPRRPGLAGRRRSLVSQRYRTKGPG